MMSKNMPLFSLICQKGWSKSSCYNLFKWERGGGLSTPIPPKWEVRAGGLGDHSIVPSDGL